MARNGKRRMALIKQVRNIPHAVIPPLTPSHALAPFALYPRDDLPTPRYQLYVRLTRNDAGRTNSPRVMFKYVVFLAGEMFISCFEDFTSATENKRRAKNIRIMSKRNYPAATRPLPSM